MRPRPQIKTVHRGREGEGGNKDEGESLFMAIIHRNVGDKSTQHKLTTISQFVADWTLGGGDWG